MAKQLSPVDPDVRIPRAVLEASERASAAQKAVYGAAEPPVMEQQGETQSTDGTPPNPPSDPTPPAAEPPSHPPQTPSQEPSSVNWELKYKTDYGRMEAERKRALAAVEQMAERMSAMERQLVTQPKPPPPQPKLQLTQEEINDYGEDFIGMVQRIARHTVEDRIAPIENVVGQTRAQIGVTQNQTMHQQMDAIYPDWRRMNEYGPFVTWSQLPDPYSGVIRGKLMQDAWNTGDARRVYAFFQGFLAEEAALNPAGGRGNGASAPTPPPSNGAAAAAPPLTLAQLAAPGGTRSAQHPPAEKPTYTQEQIAKFFTECAAGKWRHREPERAAVEADIFRAQHEGRVITGQRYIPPSPPRGFTV